MPVTLFYSFRHASRAFLAIVFIAGISLFTPSAYADPHAVFYTDRAQEQVFYNVLAALNQADYVEPVTGQFSRNTLLGRRETATQQNPQVTVPPSAGIFSQEQNPLIYSTRTDLPAALARSVTLEGDDLWTAYLVQQNSNEIDIRRSASKLLREDFCPNGLGVIGCDTRPGPSHQESSAFPTDINEYAETENLSLASNVLTGLRSEKDYQDYLTGTQKIGSEAFNLGGNGPAHPGPGEPPIPEELKFPRSASLEMGTARESNKNDEEALHVIDETSASIIAAQYTIELAPSALGDFDISDGGEKIALADENMTFKDYIESARGISSILPGSLAIAEQGLVQGEKFKRYREETPALAQFALTKEDPLNNATAGGGVKGTITVPSTAIRSQIEEGVALLANETINQKIAASTEDETPGLTTALSTAKILGISTETTDKDTKENGQVAGVIEFAQSIYDLFNKYYNKTIPTTNNPTTGYKPFSEEPGPLGFKQLIAGKNANIDLSIKNTECGFCTSLGEILNDQRVSTQVNGVYTDLYCFFFPTTAYCTQQTSRP